MPLALELDRISKLYGRTTALRAISLRLEAGQTLALLGPNGSGKTTLLKIIAGAITPTVGRGSIFGHDLGDRLSLRSEVGLLASESYLYDDLTAQENLSFALIMAGRRPSRELIMLTLEQVALGRHATERARSFSSGMKRRLAIARLLLLHPRLLLLDEPYNSLDPSGVDLIDAMVRGVAGEGRAVVLATHDVERARAVADVIAVLEAGRLVALDPIRATTPPAVPGPEAQGLGLEGSQAAGMTKGMGGPL